MSSRRIAKCSISLWIRNNRNLSWSVFFLAVPRGIPAAKLIVQIKRKFAVKGVAGATPLGLSTKVNHNMQETPAGHATPAPGHKSRRRSSMNHFITPSIVNGDKRALRSSAMLNSLAVPAGRVDENTPASRYGSLKRGGERAPA